MQFKKAALFLLCISITSLYGDIIFDKAGVYVLGDDVDVSTFGNIQITASNVTLDLGGKILLTGSAADVIVTGSLLNNVTIMNGIIAKNTFNAGITIGQDSKNILIKDIQIKEVTTTSNKGTTGINISSGCSSVVIDNITIDQGAADVGIVFNSGCRNLTVTDCYINAVHSALRFAGTAGVNNDIQGIVVNNITIAQQSPSSLLTPNYLFLMQYCCGAVVTGVVVTHTTPIDDANNTGLSLMRLENSSGNIFKDLNFLDNDGPTGATLCALDLSATSSCIFEKINITNQTSSSIGALIGIRLNTGAAFNAFNGVNIISQSNEIGSNTAIQIGTNSTSLCNGNIFDGCTIEALHNTGLSLIGIDMNGSSFNYIDNFVMTRFNSTGGGFVIGIRLINNAQSNYVKNGVMSQLQGSNSVDGITLNGADYNKFSKISFLNFQASATVRGIDIVENASYTIIDGCSISGFTATTSVIAVDFNSTLSGPSANNSIFQTVISRCFTTGSGTVTGILVNPNMTNSLIDSCIIQFNSSGSTCIGIDFGTINAGNGWSVVDNKIFNNVGSSAANSYGIRQAAHTPHFFARNIASANSTLPGNQLSNVHVGSIATRIFTTMNTTTGPASSYAVTVT